MSGELSKHYECQCCDIALYEPSDLGYCGECYWVECDLEPNSCGRAW